MSYHPPLADLSGGEAGDTQAMTFGYSAPMGPTFAQDQPFAPPGPIADTHGYDTGGTDRTEHVDPALARLVAAHPEPARRTTGRRRSPTTAGWDQNTANDRVDLNQDQGQNADGYDPFVIPYSERPIRANFAAEAHPVENIGGPYGPTGDLSDMAAFGGQGNFAYTSPADPYVTVQAPASSGGRGSYEPASGLEFVNYG